MIKIRLLLTTSPNVVEVASQVFFPMVHMVGVGVAYLCANPLGIHQMVHMEVQSVVGMVLFHSDDGDGGDDVGHMEEVVVGHHTYHCMVHMVFEVHKVGKGHMVVVPSCMDVRICSNGAFSCIRHSFSL